MAEGGLGGRETLKQLTHEAERWKTIQVASSTQRLRAFVPSVDLKNNPFRADMQLRDKFELHQLNSNPRLYLESYDRSVGAHRQYRRAGFASTSPRGYVDAHPKASSKDLAKATTQSQLVLGAAVTDLLSRQGQTARLASLAQSAEVYDQTTAALRAREKAKVRKARAKPAPRMPTFGHRPKSANRVVDPRSAVDESGAPESLPRAAVRKMGLLGADDLRALLADTRPRSAPADSDSKLIAQLAVAPSTNAQSLFKATTLPPTTPARPRSPTAALDAPSMTLKSTTKSAMKSHRPAGGAARGWRVPRDLHAPRFQVTAGHPEEGGALSLDYDILTDAEALLQAGREAAAAAKLSPDHARATYGPAVGALSPVSYGSDAMHTESSRDDADSDLTPSPKPTRRQRRAAKKAAMRARKHAFLEAKWDNSTTHTRPAVFEKFEMTAERARQMPQRTTAELVSRFAKRAAGKPDFHANCDDKYERDAEEARDYLVALERDIAPTDAAAELLRTLRTLPEDAFSSDEEAQADFEASTASLRPTVSPQWSRGEYGAEAGGGHHEDDDEDGDDESGMFEFPDVPAEGSYSELGGDDGESQVLTIDHGEEEGGGSPAPAAAPRVGAPPALDWSIGGDA